MASIDALYICTIISTLLNSKYNNQLSFDDFNKAMQALSSTMHVLFGGFACMLYAAMYRRVAGDGALRLDTTTLRPCGAHIIVSS
eukprot:scaffold24107_cov35-Prasinocladus_malaysianus.AAC.3